MEGVCVLKKLNNILQFETCFPVRSPLERKISHVKDNFFFYIIYIYNGQWHYFNSQVWGDSSSKIWINNFLVIWYEGIKDQS